MTSEHGADPKGRCLLHVQTESLQGNPMSLKEPYNLPNVRRNVDLKSQRKGRSERAGTPRRQRTAVRRHKRNADGQMPYYLLDKIKLVMHLSFSHSQRRKTKQTTRWRFAQHGHPSLSCEHQRGKIMLDEPGTACLTLKTHIPISLSAQQRAGGIPPSPPCRCLACI